MCTAITYLNQNHYFGRNLDLEYSYQEAITITPRKFPFHFRSSGNINRHFSMIGVATVVDNYPLYYDATNEHGVSMAALHFPENAVYLPFKEGCPNIGPFEFIPWVLCQCENVTQAKELVSQTNLCDIAFSSEFPNTPLHWMIADKENCLVVEPFSQGLRIYDNPVGVLTNNPPFDYHMHHLCHYLNLSPYEPKSFFSNALPLEPYSRAMGAIGLPGDASSASRFIRAAFHKLNAITDGSEAANVSQFFHMLDSVAMLNGSVRLGNALEKTVYSCCCNTDTQIYYYTTYENRQITAVQLTENMASGTKIQVFPMRKAEHILYETNKPTGEQ